MQRNFSSRLEALEALEAQGEARDWRGAQTPRYVLTAETLADLIVRLFRARSLEMDDGGAVVATPSLYGDDPGLLAIAEGLNAVTDWDDLFLGDDEIAQAIRAVEQGYLVYHVRTEVHDPARTGWRVRTFVPYPDPYWAAARAAQAVQSAAHIAGRRGIGPLDTPDALLPWLATARPFVVSGALHDAIGDILICELAVRIYGYENLQTAD